MKKDEGFHEYIMGEVFRNLDGITSKAMFGGWGIYKNGLFFALIADGQLYFKVDESNKGDFEEKDSKQFVYQMPNGKETRMSYWELPVDVLEDQMELRSWVDKSIEVAKKGKR